MMNGFQWEMLFPVNWRTAEERELHQIILHEIKSEVEKKNGGVTLKNLWRFKKEKSYFSAMF